MNAYFKGQKIWRLDIAWDVVRASSAEVLLEHSVTGVREIASPHDLAIEYLDGKLKTTQERVAWHKQRIDKTDTGVHLKQSEATRVETLRRIDYITRLQREGAFEQGKEYLRAKIKEISLLRTEVRSPHESTVYRWHRRFRQSLGDVRALVAGFDQQGGRNQSRLHAEVEALIHEKIDSIFLASKTCSAETVFNSVCLEVDRLNETRVKSDWLTKPGLRTVQRRLASLYAYELAVARYGEREAARRFAKNLGARRVSRILELVEIDHSPIDCLVVDEDRIVIGRPWITVVLDRHSRCVMGFHLSLAGHGTDAVFEALRTAMLPKGYLESRYADLGLAWDCFGWPERVLMDNGREFHANAVVQALVDAGVIGEYAASQDPNDKPHVERFLKTLNYSFIHRFPGTTLAKVHLRVGFKSEDDACLTLEELDKMIHVWICNVYHLRPHGGLDGRSPQAVWKESAEAYPPRLKMNAEDLEIVFSESCQSRIQNDGIDLNTFKFVSSSLLALRQMMPAKAAVDVKWPRHEAGHIWVWSELEKVYLKVPNKDPSLAGLTVEQAKGAKKVLAEPGNAFRSIAASAGEVVQGMIDTALKDKTLKTRRKGARDANMTSRQPRSDDSTRSQVPGPMTPSLANATVEAMPDFVVELTDFEEVLV